MEPRSSEGSLGLVLWEFANQILMLPENVGDFDEYNTNVRDQVHEYLLKIISLFYLF